MSRYCRPIISFPRVFKLGTRWRLLPSLTLWLALPKQKDSSLPIEDTAHQTGRSANLGWFSLPSRGKFQIQTGQEAVLAKERY
jgi:hypothetical protein